MGEHSTTKIDKKKQGIKSKSCTLLPLKLNIVYVVVDPIMFYIVEGRNFSDQFLSSQ